MESLNKLKKYLDEIGKLSYVVTTLRWEMDTIAPEKSFNYLIDVSTKYEMDIFNMSTSEEYIKIVEDVINDPNYSSLSIEERIYIEKLKEEYYKFKRVPKDFYEKFCTLRNNSLTTWVKAKENNDYESFKPYLKDVIEYTKKYYQYMYPNSNNLYNDMLNDYEEGVTSEVIDPLFSKLKEEIIPIVNNLKVNNIPSFDNRLNDSDFISFAKFLLNYIGFDNDRGALGIYTHGYTTKLNNNDVRITFENRNPIDAISTIVHEGGHGIFDQNIGENLMSYGTYDVSKYALHESQSRFFENILGRRKSFFIPIYDEIKRRLNTNMELDSFIKYFNDAKRSKIRTEADELTYCLHIIIRYEIEKEIFNNNYDLDKLPELWNSKYKEYLGVDVENYSEGILQDMHWSDGSFGYFPSYLMGSIFDGMLLEKIENTLGNVDVILSEGRIKEITKFLNENIHRYGGSYNVCEVCKRVCGKDMDVMPLVKYFKEKYM